MELQLGNEVRYRWTKPNGEIKTSLAVVYLIKSNDEILVKDIDGPNKEITYNILRTQIIEINK